MPDQVRHDERLAGFLVQRLLQPPDGNRLSTFHVAKIVRHLADDFPALLFVESPRAVVSRAAEKRDALEALIPQRILRGAYHQRRDTASMKGGHYKNLTDTVALPARKADDIASNDGHGAIRQRRSDPLIEEPDRPARGDVRVNRSMARMPCIVPNARERRNVSGARKSYSHIVGGLAQSPSTAFAMMLRCTSFEPA